MSWSLTEHRFGHLLRVSPLAELLVSWATVVAGDTDQSPAGGALATKPINAQSPEEKPNKPGVELLHPARRMAGRGRHGTHLTSAPAAPGSISPPQPPPPHLATERGGSPVATRRAVVAPRPARLLAALPSFLPLSSPQPKGAKRLPAAPVGAGHDR